MEKVFFFGFLLVVFALAQGTTVKVANTMGPGVTVSIKCASGDDTIPEKSLQDGQDITWSFTGYPWTLFYCDVATSDGKSQHWDVYKDFWGDVGWFLRGDGIYKGNLDGSGINKDISW
ncbi:hypothetical protein FO519_009665 [Halicephalobus sp. NKZ332]|nr:hypothetical protein FO519_009665 [Halicephalobus sp. NKZ332]